MKLDECRLELDKNSAYLLSKKLKEGEPCPVCGSPDHPAPAVHNGSDDTAALEKRFEKAQDELKDAEAALKEAEKNALVAAESFRTASEQLDRAIKDHGQKNRDYEDERQKLPDEWRTLEIEQIRLRIEKADTKIKGRLKEIEEWEAALAELRVESEKQKEAVAKLRIEENSIRTELRVNVENLVQLEAEMKRVSENLLGVRRELAEQLEGSAFTSAAAELARLAENDRKLEGRSGDQESQKGG